MKGYNNSATSFVTEKFVDCLLAEIKRRIDPRPNHRRPQVTPSGVVDILTHSANLI